MGKRSNFERKPRDYYPTPLKAVIPLITHLPQSFAFAEPCAGDGRLINHIESLHNSCDCIFASDIEPQDEDVEELDALELSDKHLVGVDLIITNPPWSRAKKDDYILHKMIEHFSNLRPTWLLFDADWIHTEQSSELVRSRLVKIVSIGRVKWIEDSAGTGKDNCCWYLFDKNNNGSTQFYGR